MARKIIIYYDIDNKILVDSEGFPLNPKDSPRITYKEEPIVNLYIRHQDLTPYTELIPTNTYSVSIDDDFDHNSALFIKTLNDDINVEGDWISDGNADITQGQMSIRLNGVSSVLQTALGTKESITSKLEIKCIEDVTAKQIFIERFPFTCYNIQDDNGTIPPEPVEDFYNKTESDARYIQSGDYLAKDNTVPYTPTADYNPATKKFVEDSLGNDATAIHIDADNELASVTEKTTPTDDDVLMIEDSENAFVKKKVKLVNIITESLDLTSIENEVVNNTLGIATNTGNISINFDNISINSTNITTNITELADQDARIDTIANRITQNETDISQFNYKRIEGRLTTGQQYFDCGFNIDISKTVTAILKDSPLLTPNFGIYVNGDRISLDSEIEFNDKDIIGITFEPITEDCINFSTETSDNSFTDFHMQTETGTVDLDFDWNDGNTETITIGDTKTACPHTYSSDFQGVLRNGLVKGDFTNIKTIWFDNQAGDADIFWVGCKKAVNLKNLYCRNTSIETLDVAPNILLEDLQVSGSKIKKLDLTQNIELKILHADNMNLDEVDLSQNTKLETIYLHENNLTSFELPSDVVVNLDLSGNKIPVGASNGSTSGSLNKLLADIDATDVHNGSLDISNQQPDIAVSSALVGALTAKSWNIIQ